MDSERKGGGRVGALVACVLATAMMAPGLWTREQVAGAAPAEAPASGEQQVPVDGVQRRYLLHLPVGYRAGQAYPLLIAYHDRYLPPQRWARIAGLNAIANRQNFIVIYPEAEDGRWNLGIPAPAPPQPQRYRRGRFGFPGRYPGGGYPGGYPGGGYPGAGRRPGEGGYPGNGALRATPGRDLAFFDAILARAEQEYDATPRRVYLTGMGLGGMMALRVACMRSSAVAGVGVVGAALPKDLGEECVPARPVSLLMISGTRDRVVPYGGGRASGGYRVLSAVNTAKFWAKADNCPGKAEKQQRQFRAGEPKVRILDWAGCAESTRVQLDTLPGGGGAWPGGGYQPDSRFGKTSQAVNGGEAVWEFLQGPEHRQGGE